MVVSFWHLKQNCSVTRSWAGGRPSNVGVMVPVERFMSSIVATRLCHSGLRTGVAFWNGAVMVIGRLLL